MARRSGVFTPSPRLPHVAVHHHPAQPAAHRLRIVQLICIVALFGSLLPGGSAQAQDAGAAEARAGNAVSPITINELHYNHDVEAELVEFVELHNIAKVAVNLGGWALDGGIDYVFPANTWIAPGGYLVVAEDVAALKAKWPAAASVVVGPYERRLASDGDTVEVRDNEGDLLDLVEYGLGFPWPTVGEAPGHSIQLLNPEYDNARAGNWRSAAPTPGQRNAVFTYTVFPLFEQVSHTPRSPKSDEPVQITVSIDVPQGIQSMRLFYQVVEPGNYIALQDPAYQSNWTAVDMQFSADRGYQATLPASLQRHRRLIRYRIEMVDRAGTRVVAPFPDDPQPNFAYFVYDGIPPWTGSVTGDGNGRVTHDFNAMRPVALYQVLAKPMDVADAMFMPPSDRAEGYVGNDYLWQATLVYDGVVYDHVRFRARGGRDRYATGKSNWKITFNRGHYLQAHDDYGQPYRTRWDKLNLNSVIQQVHRDRRGEQGLFESITYRLFNLAGVEGPYTHYAHLRVITGASEQGGNQYEGDFWGLYLAIEQPDGKMLDEHDMPDGNLYKMENWTGELNHQGHGMASDGTDLSEFMYAYTYMDPGSDWWRANFDLEKYYLYRAITEFVRHYDVNEGKNYLYFHNPETGKWSIHPWDVDLTWERDMPGDGNEPFRNRVLTRGEFQVEYQNHLRELRDLLFNPDQMFPMLDEHAGWVDTPGDGPSLVDADRAKWDYNPIFYTRYVVWGRTLPGHFYRKGQPQTFRGMVTLMKNWVVSRSEWLDLNVLTDRENPATPGVYYRGAAGYPADSLRFESGGYSDPQGSSTFAALEWRIAEINYPGAPVYDAQRPHRYEIEPSWESGEISSFMASLTPPKGVVQPGRAYRVRVRMKDNSGRWSHWSPPVQFVAGAPLQPPISTLTISEIMYHPLPEQHFSSDDLEFVELYNLGRETVDLSNVRLTDGLDFTFPPGTGLAPGGHMVVARDIEAFIARYGFRPLGPYDRRLSNGGDTITAVDPFGRTLFSVTYDDSSPWPESADGGGPSLTHAPLNSDPASPTSWRASNAINGSPAGYDPAAIVISEVLTVPGPGQDLSVELYNPTGQSHNVGLWYLSDVPGDPRKARIPEGISVPANGYVTIGADVLRQIGADGGIEWAQSGRQTLYITSANGARMTGYSHRVDFSVAAPGVTVGRHVDSRGQEQFVAQSRMTLGAANAGPRAEPVVISAIGYGGEPDYIELANAGSQAVKLYDESGAPGTAAWQLSGAFFRFPAGVALGPGERLLVTEDLPETVCLSGMVGDRQVYGPLTRLLDESGEEVALWQPIRRGPGNVLDAVLVERVEYGLAGGWPMEGAPGLLRTNLDAFGNDPANWSAAALPGAAAGTPGSLCSLRATAAGDAVEVVWSLLPDPATVEYRVLRGTGFNKENLVEVGRVSAAAPSAPLAESAASAAAAVYRIEDAGAAPGVAYVYWLESVSTGDAVQELGLTSVQTSHLHTFLPVLGGR